MFVLFFSLLDEYLVKCYSFKLIYYYSWCLIFFIGVVSASALIEYERDLRKIKLYRDVIIINIVIHGCSVFLLSQTLSPMYDVITEYYLKCLCACLFISIPAIFILTGFIDLYDKDLTSFILEELNVEGRLFPSTDYIPTLEGYFEVNKNEERRITSNQMGPVHACILRNLDKDLSMLFDRGFTATNRNTFEIMTYKGSKLVVDTPVTNLLFDHSPFYVIKMCHVKGFLPAKYILSEWEKYPNKTNDDYNEWGETISDKDANSMTTAAFTKYVEDSKRTTCAFYLLMKMERFRRTLPERCIMNVDELLE